MQGWAIQRILKPCVYCLKALCDYMYSEYYMLLLILHVCPVILQAVVHSVSNFLSSYGKNCLLY